MTTKPTVATPSPIMAELAEKRQLCHDLMGGTKAMIAAGQRWLLPHLGELVGGAPNANYHKRLKDNILRNFLGEAVAKQAGKLFAKPVTLSKKVPTDLAAICENIDRQGCGIDPFARDVVGQALVDGVSYVLVDSPRAEGVTTQAEAKAVGLRPYAVHIKPCCLLEALAEVVGEVMTLVRVRIRECSQKPAADGWGYEEVEQIRVLYREEIPVEKGVSVVAVRFEIWREDKTATTDDKWYKVEEGVTGMTRIAIVPFYTNRTGFMIGEPPNQSIAELNLMHWRSRADQISCIAYNRFAQIWGAGWPADTQLAVGPAKCHLATDPEATLAYLEPSGAGVEAGRKDLEDIEKSIETASAALRIEHGGTVTATAAAIDSAETNAGLKAVAQGMKDSLEQVLMHMAEMMGLGLDAGGEVEVNDDFGGIVGTPAGLASLDKARALGDISRPGYLAELKRRGELADDFDVDADGEIAGREMDSLEDDGGQA